MQRHDADYPDRFRERAAIRRFARARLLRDAHPPPRTSHPVRSVSLLEPRANLLPGRGAFAPRRHAEGTATHASASCASERQSR